MRLVLKYSKLGLAMASVFLLLASGVFAWLLYTSAVNPGDSGEGGILLVMLAMPWVNYLPHDLVGPEIAIGCIFFNALVLYCLFGGLGIKKFR